MHELNEAGCEAEEFDFKRDKKRLSAPRLAEPEL
jgi:hypothetical protein